MRYVTMEYEYGDTGRGEWQARTVRLADGRVASVVRDHVDGHSYRQVWACARAYHAWMMDVEIALPSAMADDPRTAGWTVRPL